MHLATLPLQLSLQAGVLGAIILAILLGLSSVVFGTNMPAPSQSDIVRQLAAWRVCDPMGGPLRRVVAKTADYTIVSPLATDGTGDASGTIFTNRGATGAVVLTLPAPILALTGLFYDVVGIAAQSITVATATADTLIVTNDTAADSLAIATASDKIGAAMRFICDGTSWIGFGLSTGAGGTADTFTVAT